MMGPRITTIVAVFNGANTIERCLKSFVEQTYNNKELIIMDGGSTDGTADILTQWAAHIGYWESAKDRGIAHAWNKAIDKASGDWFLFIGADDVLASPDVMAHASAELQQGWDVIYGQLKFDGGPHDGQVIGEVFNPSKLRRRMCIPHPAAFHARELFCRFGQYDETYKIALDYELLLRKSDLRARHFRGVVTVMAGTGVSSRQLVRSLGEARRAQRTHLSDPAWRRELWYWLYRARSAIR